MCILNGFNQNLCFRERLIFKTQQISICPKCPHDPRVEGDTQTCWWEVYHARASLKEIFYCLYRRGAWSENRWDTFPYFSCKRAHEHDMKNRFSFTAPFTFSYRNRLVLQFPEKVSNFRGTGDVPDVLPSTKTILLACHIQFCQRIARLCSV